MGSCMSKKTVKRQQSHVPKSNADFKGTPSSLTSSQSTPVPAKMDFPSKEKAPPEEEAVKEVLSETSKPDLNNRNNIKSTDDDIKEKPLIEEAATGKNPEHNSLKKKGSFKKDKVRKEQAAQEGSSLTISSGAKEDVDAILIQCGRLSRSSSGKVSNEILPRLNNSSNQYSGSKRHAMETKDEDEDQDQVTPKENHATPSHRRALSRDLTVETKRSSSRDRSTEEGKRVTGRRISPSPRRKTEPSPGRRSETSVEKTRPAKQNLTTSRENTPSFEARKRPATSTKRATNSGDFNGGNTSSSRSRSPAPRPPECSFPSSLSRSSSRKTEQSPFRRPLNDDMPNYQSSNKNDEQNGGSHGESSRFCAKIPEKCNGENAEAVQKKTTSMAQMDETETNSKKERLALKEISGNCVPIRDQLLSCRAAPSMKAPSKVSTKEQSEMDSFEETGTVKCSAKRVHRRMPSFGTDILGENETLNESIQSMVGSLVSSEHLSKATSDQFNGGVEGGKAEGLIQISRSRSSRRSRDQLLLFEAANPPLNSSDTEIKAFSIPASVSKARSILEAVADLNSSVNSNSSIYSMEKSLVSEPLEQGKSARFFVAGNFEAEQKLSAKVDSEKVKEIQRNASARSSNVERTEQIQEESAGSNDDSTYQALLSSRLPESANRLTARRLHKYLSSEEDLASFSKTEDSAPKSFCNDDGDDDDGDDMNNSNNITSLKQSSARYFNISPEEVILNPYLGIKASSAGECLSRSSFVPVITLSKKEFQNGKKTNNLQNSRTSSEHSKQSAHHQNHYPDLDFEADSRAISDPGICSRGNFNTLSKK